jgi:uncharacterized membrane protein (DUF4010 family)
MDTFQTLSTLALSLGLGLLVGLQRERKGEPLAGIRTFALITLLGTLGALLGDTLGPAAATWIIAAGAVAIAVLLATGGLIKSRSPDQHHDIGLTTEIAALVMYALGAYLVEGDQKAAIVVGGAVALLLHWKAPLHGFVQKMGDADVSAIMQFVLVALVIFPVLPNRDMGPYGVLNPFKIWLVVVLIVGMSLAGYVLSKFLPPSVGTFVGGAVGGLVSSTAATVSYARRSRSHPERWPLALQAIMTANTVSVLRVIALLALFSGSLFSTLVRPIVLMTAAMAALTFATMFFKVPRSESVAKDDAGNPAELRSALTFGGLYALVKLAVAWGKANFGASALYAIGALSGLTDMDAITLSISDMARNAQGAAGPLDPYVAWRVILLAICANLVFKGGSVLVLATGPLKRWTVIFFLTAIAAGGAIFLLFPAPSAPATAPSTQATTTPASGPATRGVSSGATAPAR